MMRIIEKKILPEYFEDVLSGKKTFELRLADFECKPGDILVLKEWDQEKGQYTGREISRKISYVLRTKDISFWSKEDIDKYGFQIISFECDKNDKESKSVKST